MNRIFVISVKNIIFCLAITVVLVSICLIGNTMVEQVIETAAMKRLLPIYSVETEEKKVALTFDCAWRSRGYFIYSRNFGNE